MLDHDRSIQAAIHKAIAAGVAWLIANRQADGGWGTEPQSGHDSEASRLISTMLAIHGFAAVGEHYSSSIVVRQACDWMHGIYVDRTGWPPLPGASCDPASTARAISALARARDPFLTKDRSTQVTDHLVSWQRGDQLWPIAVEGVLQGDASGAIIFNQNTNLDVLMAILEGGAGTEHLELLRRIAMWLRSTQDPSTGLWRLQAPSQIDPAVITWSTSEWIVGVASVGLFLASHADAFSPVGHRRRIDLGHALLIAACLVLLAALCHLPTWSVHQWDSLTKGQRGAVLTVIGGVAIGILTEVILSPFRHFLRQIRGRIERHTHNRSSTTPKG
jgi:hypothetical protein